MKWLLIGIIVACTVASDVLQSYEMKRSGTAGNVARSAKVLKQPLLLLSIVFLAISFFAFLKVLALAPVSFVAPVTASGYVFNAILAKLLLNEDVGPKRWAGIVLLIIGIAIVSVY